MTKHRIYSISVASVYPHAVALALFISGCGPSQAPLPAPATPIDLNVIDIRQAIERDGADAVVAHLSDFGGGEGWLYVIEQIGGGDQTWLDLVPLLEPGTDGGASLGLHNAVSRALPHNASGVLSMISDQRPADGVCAMNEIEPEAADVVAYYRAATTAVESVTDPVLQSVRSECLAALRSGAAK